MKLRIYLIALIACTLAGCETDNRQVTADMLNFPPAEGREQGNAPVISFDSTTVHFGKIAIGQKIRHSFRFINTGDSPLVISQVTPSCGCTTAKDWPKEPVNPGDGGQITIEFDSKGFPGHIEKSISVLTNCIPKAWELKIKGEVSGVESDQPKLETPIEMERTQ